MTEVVVKTFSELEAYTGEHRIPGIVFRYAAKSLGVTAWGMNVLELAGDCAAYPGHDHKKDGQEEVYVILRGSATLRVDDKQWELAEGSFARVPPACHRHLQPGKHGATVLAIGATPGEAYKSA